MSVASRRNNKLRTGALGSYGLSGEPSDLRSECRAVHRFRAVSWKAVRRGYTYRKRLKNNTKSKYLYQGWRNKNKYGCLKAIGQRKLTNCLPSAFRMISGGTPLNCRKGVIELHLRNKVRSHAEKAHRVAKLTFVSQPFCTYQEQLVWALPIRV